MCGYRHRLVLYCLTNSCTHWEILANIVMSVDQLLVIVRLSFIRQSLWVFGLWGSPVHWTPHAVIMLTIHYDQQLHAAIIQYIPQLYYISYALFQMLYNVTALIGSSHSAKLPHYCKFRQNMFIYILSHCKLCMLRIC